jgi:hypothetical protein
MNAKLNNLWNQASKMTNESVSPDLGNDYFFMVYEQIQRENFAKLIVAACADAADMAQEANCRYVGDYVVESMELGVDEGAATWRTKHEIQS